MNPFICKTSPFLWRRAFRATCRHYGLPIGGLSATPYLYRRFMAMRIGYGGKIVPSKDPRHDSGNRPGQVDGP